MHILIIAAVVALSAGAQLPSSSYLPSSNSGPNFGAASPADSLYRNQIDGKAKLEDNGNTRPQQAIEKNAAVLKLTNEAGDSGFQYAYETSNGIQAQESGKELETHGEFSYTGDDGQIYSVKFTAGKDGFRPEGAHLPVAPPTPVEILLALKQNEQDEAAGIFDDGLYHPENDEKTDQSAKNQGHGNAGNHQESFNSNTGYSY